MKIHATLRRGAITWLVLLAALLLLISAVPVVAATSAGLYVSIADSLEGSANRVTKVRFGDYSTTKIYQGNAVTKPYLVALDSAAGKAFTVLSDAAGQRVVSLDLSTGDTAAIAATETSGAGRSITGLALDRTARLIYYATASSLVPTDNKIRQVSYDGTFPMIIYSSSGAAAKPLDLAVDHDAGKLFMVFSEGAASWIAVAGLDGAGLAEVSGSRISNSGVSLGGLTLDTANKYLYYSVTGSLAAVNNRIYRMTYDGADVRTLYSGGVLDKPSYLALGQNNTLYAAFTGSGLQLVKSSSLADPANMVWSPVPATSVASPGVSITGIAAAESAPLSVVTAVSPASGADSGGATVTITGSGFTGATAVSFGGAAAASFTVDSDTRITAVSPAGIGGTVHITVTTPGGVSATGSGDQFTYVATCAVQPSGLVAWWRGEGNARDAAGSNSGFTQYATATENSSATATCGPGTTISAFTVAYGTNCPAPVTTTNCASTCALGGTSCSATFSNVACGVDPCLYVVKQGGIALVCSPVATAPGKVGQALSFNGTTDYLAALNAPALNFGTGPFSLSAWIRTTDTGEWKRIVAKRGPSSTSWYSLALYSGRVVFEISGAANVWSTGSVADGAWHHVAVTRDPLETIPRKYHLYIDGTENNTLSDGGLNLDTTAPLEIGKWNTEAYGGTIFSGLIDEVQVLNRALTTAEIQRIYAAGTLGLCRTPTVTAISPTSGTTAGGTKVTITGTELDAAEAVAFGPKAAAGFTVDSSTQVTALSPPNVGGLVADITVTTPGGTSAVTSADQFTYIQEQAKNQTTSTVYTLLATALSSALPGAEIRAFDSLCDGMFILTKGLFLNGGYDGTFLAKGGNATTLNGGLTVTGGDSRAEDLIVKGTLKVQGGSLRANRVSVR